MPDIPIYVCVCVCVCVQSCPTLCDAMDYILPGLSVHGILQVRILEWIAISVFRDLANPGIEPRSPALQEPPDANIYIRNILYPATDVLFDVNEGAGKNSSLNLIAQVLGAQKKM